MDTPPPDDIHEQDLLAALAADWGVEARRVTYLPKGLGSYHWVAETASGATHFVTVDDLETKPWIGTQRDDTFCGLTAAYEAALALSRRASLDVAVAPLPNRNGSVTLRLSSQYSLAVFPYVAGVAGAWGDPIAPQARDRLLEQLARLHLATPKLSGGVTTRPFDLPERPVLAAALAALNRPWTGGPLSEAARHAMADHVATVGERLVQFDDLARRLDSSYQQLVITHGEPHPGNLIWSERGVRLIDWDTVALALPERDLWMLDDGSPEGLARYSELTGRIVDPNAIAFYRLAWTLSDIASFAGMFRAEHQMTAWMQRKWQGFLGLLAGGSSVPYTLA